MWSHGACGPLMICWPLIGPGIVLLGGSRIPDHLTGYNYSFYGKLPKIPKVVSRILTFPNLCFFFIPSERQYVHGYYPFNEGILDEGRREKATESRSLLYKFYE